MAKDNTAKTVLIVGGIGLAIYLFANASIRSQLKDALDRITGTLPAGGGGGGFPNINIGIPGLQWPLADLALPELKQCYPELKVPGITDLFPNITNLIPERGSATPGDHATALDLAYSLPSWAKGALAVGATALGAYGGYQIIRTSAPVLRVLGTQAARAIGGAGSLIGNVIGKTAATTTGGIATKVIPAAAARTTAAAGPGLMAGVLPGLAISGIVEGAFQIARTFAGAKTVGMTGVVPLDLINLIRGTLKFGPSAERAPGLFEWLFAGAFGTAAGAAPAAPAPSAGETYNQAQPAEIRAAAARPGVTTTATQTASAAAKTQTSYPALTQEQQQQLIATIKQRNPDIAPGAAEVGVAHLERYAEAMRNLGR